MIIFVSMITEQDTQLNYILEKIREANPIHFKKLRKNLKKQNESYLLKANDFFNKYQKFALDNGKDLDFGIACYLKMLSDFTRETVLFMETGEYSTKSFADADERVYNNPEVMEYYMHGLLISQFLWVHHNDIHEFFIQHLGNFKTNTFNYLEIGAGHGMYISEAIRIFGSNVNYDVVDISPTSIEISKQFIDKPTVEYHLSDIFDYRPNKKYDFITMGEVLEHVEEPIKLLQQIKELLHPDGCLFMTTPANAPAIDHIYLFRNAQEIIDICHKAGFEVVYEYQKYVEDVPKEIAERMKITLMYGAFLKIKK